MACGLPIVVTENVGAKDVVTEGINGFVVPACDSKALQDAILFFYENPDRRQEMANAAYDSIQQNTWEDYGKRWVAKWRGLLGRANKGW
jgi:glycosyltransferase involved in cell wall biosynthesis